MTCVRYQLTENTAILLTVPACWLRLVLLVECCVVMLVGESLAECRVRVRERRVSRGTSSLETEDRGGWQSVHTGVRGVDTFSWIRTEQIER